MYLDGPTGPFKAVRIIIGKKLLGPFGKTNATFSCSGGPIQSSRKQSLLGSSVNINAGYACSGGPIQSCRKHSREESTEPIREHRYHLSMLRWAHSKQSESIPPGPLREHRYWLCMLWWAHSKQSETFWRKLLGPSMNIDAGFPCSGGPIQHNEHPFG